MFLFLFKSVLFVPLLYVNCVPERSQKRGAHWITLELLPGVTGNCELPYGY